MKQKMKGGLADHDEVSDFDDKQLSAGIKVEMEHTDDKSIAKEIAMDHLKEDPKYYEKLKEIEKYDRVDEEADGKRELEDGKEDLEKKRGLSRKNKNRFNAAKEQVSDQATARVNRNQGSDTDKIDRMEGNARTKAISKLTATTKNRRNPETNEVEFLMHRGMYHGEYENEYQNKGKEEHKWDPNRPMAWAPNIAVAHMIGGSDDGDQYPGGDPKHKGTVVSAWVPEKHLHSSLKQYGAAGADHSIRTEDEWLVNHPEHPKNLEHTTQPTDANKGLSEQPDNKNQFPEGYDEFDRQKKFESGTGYTARVKKSELQERWELLKAKLDSEKSIISIAEAMQPNQEEGEEGDQAPQEDEESDIQDQDEVPETDEGAEQPPEAGEEQPEEQPEEVTEEQPEEQPEEEEQQPEGEDQEDPQELFKDEMLQMQMQNQGYSQSQIDYILHGHIPVSASSEDVKMEADKAMSELKQVSAKNDQTQESQHRQELHDQNKEQRDKSHESKHEHESRMSDLAYKKELLALERERDDDKILSDKHHKHLSAEQERTHAQRMKDLEYETAQKDHSGSDIDLEHKKKILNIEFEKQKKEAELEVKFKEEEYRIKIEQLKQSHKDKIAHTKEAHKHKMSTQSETNKMKMTDHKKNIKLDAAKTSEAEKKGLGKL